MNPLRPYQKKAADALLEHGYKYLALDPGLGKTLIMLYAAAKSKAERVLVFSPVSAQLAWQAEIKKWWPSGPTPTIIPNKTEEVSREPGIYLASYHIASQEIDTIRAIRRSGAKNRFDFMFIDEGHFLKTYGSQRTQSIFKGVKPCVKKDHTFMASGTPAPNHYGELYVPFRALAQNRIKLRPGVLQTQEEFEEEFCKVVTVDYGGGPVRSIQGSKNAEEMRKKLKGFMFRLSKKACAPELPELQMETTPVEPTSRGLLFEELARYANIIHPEMTDEELLHSLQYGGEHAARIRVALGMSKVSAGVNYVSDFLGGTKRKVAVWASHQIVIDAIKRGLDNFSPVKIDGRDGQEARRHAVDRFLNDSNCRVFIGNIRAAGVALTLFGENCDCSDCFFFETDLVPGNNAQAAQRLHRIGQKNPVLARIFRAYGTPDDRIQAAILRKERELGEVFEKLK